MRVRAFLEPALAAVLALPAGCGGGREATPAAAPTAANGQVPAAAPAPARSACPADSAQLAPYAAPAPAAGDHLTPEVVPNPPRGHCDREQNLLAQTEAKPRVASTVTTANGPRLEVHRIHAMAVLPAARQVLLASATGLWVHDAATMTKLARLVPARTVDVVATPDGASFAFVTQDAAPPVARRTRTLAEQEDADTEAAEASEPPRELVVVDAATLAVKRRIAGVPDGRMSLAHDGGRVTFAVGDDGVVSYDVATGTRTAFTTNDTVETAITMPARPTVVAYGGHDNAVAFHDLATGAALPQSTSGRLPLVQNRDLLVLYADATGNRLLAGGADNFLHVYEGMLADEPKDAQRVQLHGNVVDVTCCVEGAIVAATDSLNVAWIKDGQVVRQVGPFLPDAASAPARVGVVGDQTIVSMVGRVFTWTRDGFFVQPDFFAGEEVARSVQGDDTLLVLRSRGWLEFHRVPTAGGLSLTSSLLATADWAIIDATLEAKDDARVFVGRRHGRMVAAFIPNDGPATLARGPMVGIVGEPVLASQGDGIHYAVWNLEDQVAVLDVVAQTLTATHTIEGPRPTSVALTWENGQVKLVDQAGATRTLRPIVREVSQSELLR